MGKIDRRSWMAIHPYGDICDTDTYYLLIAEELIQTVNLYLGKLPHITIYESEWIACCLTAYYEDRSSGINLFRSLNELHKSMFGTYIPFYRTDIRYDTEGINSGDINFVIWNCLQQIQIYKKESLIISPYAKEIIQLGYKVYTKFKKIFRKDYSGTNHLVRSYFYMFDINSVDQVLERVHSLKTRTYLLATYDDFLRYKDNGAMVATRPGEEIDSPIMLGLYPHQWYAQMIGFYRKEHSALISNIEILPLDSYLYEFSKNGDQVFSLLDSDKTVHLKLSTYLDVDKLVAHEHYLHSSLIKYNNRWELLPPVQITRSKISSLKPIVENELDKSVYIIKNTNERLNKLSINHDVHFFASFNDLIAFFKDQKIIDELKEYFTSSEPVDYILYPKSKNSVYVLKGVARFIVSDKNQMYDRDYAAEMLPSFMTKSSMNMRKILINMMLMNMIVDMCTIDNNADNNRYQDNIQFLSSYLLQHLYSDKSI